MEKIVIGLAVFGGLVLVLGAIGALAAALAHYWDAKEQDKTRGLFRSLYRFTGRSLNKEQS